MWECERCKSLNQSVQQSAFWHNASASVPLPVHMCLCGHELYERFMFGFETYREDMKKT